MAAHLLVAPSLGLCHARYVCAAPQSPPPVLPCSTATAAAAPSLYLGPPLAAQAKKMWQEASQDMSKFPGFTEISSSSWSAAFSNDSHTAAGAPASGHGVGREFAASRAAPMPAAAGCV